MLIITGFLVLDFAIRVSNENGSFSKQVRDAILYLLTFNFCKNFFWEDLACLMFLYKTESRVLILNNEIKLF